MLADTQTAESPRRTGAARWFVPAVVLLVLVLWASAFIAIRSAAHSLSPGPIALLRLLVGTLVVGGLAARRREPLPRGRPLVLLVIYGLAWFGAYNVALNAAERHLDPGTSAMLVNVAPVLIALAAGAFLGEGFPRQLLIGMTVAFGGVVVISLGEGGRHGDGAGVGFALAAAVLYGVGVLSQKVALRSTAPLQATWIGCLTATLALMPFAPQAAAELAHARPQDVLLTVYLGVFPTAAGFVLWSYALSRTRAGALSSTTLAVPAIAVLLSWLILGELPTLAAGVGGAICLIGVAVASRRPVVVASPPPLGRSGGVGRGRFAGSPLVMDDAPRPRSDAAAPPERGGLLDRLDGFQRRHPAAGLPLAVLYKFFDDRGPYLAALLTYYVFVSLFPLLLLLFSALGFFLQGHPALRHDIQHSALSNFPVVGTKLSRNVGSFRGSGAGLVIGILGTLYGGLGAMQAAQFGFNWVYGVPRNKQPNALRSRLRSIGLVALLGSGVLLSTGIAVVLSTGNEISQVLGPVVETGGYLLSYIINVALFSVAFQLLTARELQIRQVLTGGMIAAGAWMLLQVFGTTVLSARLSRTNALYGVFAVVLTTILWLYLQSLILMLAAEINVVRHRRLWPRALLAPFTDEVELTDADRRTYAMYPAAQQFKGFQTISTRFTPEGDARVGGAPDGDARGGARPPGTGERNGGRPSSSARAVPSRSDASR